MRGAKKKMNRTKLGEVITKATPHEESESTSSFHFTTKVKNNKNRRLFPNDTVDFLGPQPDLSALVLVCLSSTLHA